MTKEQYKEVVDLAKKKEDLTKILLEIIDPDTVLVFARIDSDSNSDWRVIERFLTKPLKEYLGQAHQYIIDDIESELKIIEQRISEI